MFFATAKFGPFFFLSARKRRKGALTFPLEKLWVPVNSRTLDHTARQLGGNCKVRGTIGYVESVLMCNSGFAPALRNGGPAALVWGLIFSITGTMALALSLAEMASICPIAGAQYHWTALFSPPKNPTFCNLDARSDRSS